MKLFVKRCNSCHQKIYIKNKATTRTNLRSQLGSDSFHARCGNCQYEDVYEVGDVKAETETTSTATGVVVGGLIGLLGGPIGAIIGGGIGAAIGGADDTEEKKRVDNFNKSW